ncbi:MAG: phosphonoacetate hydrolase [Actinomycetota bacterium]|nr:phosphonoacetate hydrolase [Actinomycetota bacterium]
MSQDEVARALDVLCSDQLEPIVDMVLRSIGPDEYECRSAEGRSTFRRDEKWNFTVTEVVGRDPLANDAADAFVGLAAERANLHPSRADNAYPNGREQVAQLFDSPDAPDLCVLHAAAHNWEDQGGHRGEHGSIDAIQARAPFIMAGKGVKARGRVPRHCRLIDVAPTVLALLGAETISGVGLTGAPRDDALLARQDGEPLTDLLDGETPAHVVGFLLDGCNPNVLYAMAESGEAPNVARIMSLGTTFDHGALSGLPTATLANHTATLTGCYPGHHGILHNAWYDRAKGEQVITNSPATWPWAMQRLRTDVETIHEAVQRVRPGAFTASFDEPADRGASHSTFDAIRDGRLPDRFPADQLEHSTERFVRPSKDYRRMSIIDHLGAQDCVDLWAEVSPAFTWLNFTLTDAAFHEGGPHSEMAAASVRDTDARLGRVLEAVERAGVFDDTAFFLVADHGMEETNPEVRGDWGPVLRDAGLSFRDEAYGFLYFLD